MTKLFIGDGLSEEYDEVVGNPNSIEVSVGMSDGQMVISDKNLFSRGYCRCDGVVLLGNKYVVLSHYFNVSHPSEEEETFVYPNIYLNEMKNRLKRVDNSDLVAVVLSGSDGYPNPRRSFHAIKATLEGLQIPVVGEHYDRYGEQKDLVVIPKRKEVIMFENRNGKFRKLS